MMSGGSRNDIVNNRSGAAGLKNLRNIYTFDNESAFASDKPVARGQHSKTERCWELLKEKPVSIILGYSDGLAFVEEQLNSIFHQSLDNIHVLLCDDKSAKPFTFDTVQIEDSKLSKLSIVNLPQNIGPTNNFLNALESLGDDFEFFAFSDQDDIWRQKKLERAFDAIGNVPVNTPALYCARTEITDAKGENIHGLSPFFKRPPSFQNALVQNICGGNIMVLNQAARDLIVTVSRNITVVSHDWWCYLFVSGVGGYVFYDPVPCLKYRQHSNNLVGANTSWAARLHRVRGLLQGRFRAWNDINLRALSELKHILTSTNQRVLDDFIDAHQSSLPKRLMLFKRSGIYRQTLFGDLGLLLGTLLNKV